MYAGALSTVKQRASRNAKKKKRKEGRREGKVDNEKKVCIVKHSFASQRGKLLESEVACCLRVSLNCGTAMKVAVKRCSSDSDF